MYLTDFIVVFGLLLIYAAIGVYYRLTGNKQQTINEYLLGDRKMSVWPVSFSLMATCMSAITLLGLSSENYSYGLQFIAINIGYGVCTPVIAYLFLPIYFQLKTTSVYEYLERRFGKWSKNVASLSSIIQLIFYMGIVLYAPALTLETIVQFSKNTIIISLGLVCIFYSTLGGLKAVVITDVFQAFIMYASVLSIIIFASLQLGSFSEIFKIAKTGHRINLFNYNFDLSTRYTIWNLIIGGGFVFMSSYAVGPSYVQKYLSTKDLKSAQKTIWLNWPILTVLNLVCSFSGLAIYSKYHTCDPVLAGNIKKHDEEYLLGNQEISSWLISFSLMSTCTSSITILGISSENYSYGLQYIAINIGYLLFTPAIAYLFVPVFYAVKSRSSLEYIEKRFGNKSKRVMSLFVVVQYIMYMGVALYGPVIAMEAIIQIPKEYILIILGSVCIFYSTIGGIKAVVLTDVFQSFLMYAALLSIVISASIKLDGFSKMLQIANSGHRLNFFNYTLDFGTRYTFWNIVFGNGFIFFSLFAVSPSYVQKYLATKDLKSAQNAIWFNLPILVLINVITSLTGIAMYSTFSDCDPVLDNKIQKYDELMPYYVLENFSNYPGLSGLFVSGILSASLSTLSSIMNSLAAILLEDYVKPLYLLCYKKSLSATLSLFVTKLLVFILGAICIALAFWADKFQSILQLGLTIFSLIGGPMLGLFSLGMFTTIANDEGSCLGFLFGFIGSFLLSLKTEDGSNKLPLSMEGCEHYDEGLMNSTMTQLMDRNRYNDPTSFTISFLWLCPIAFLLTVISGLIFSKIVELCGINNEFKAPVSTNLLTPPLAKFIEKRHRNFETGRRYQESVQITNL